MEAHLTPEQLERLLVHADWLRALARRMVNDSAAADDLVQETWVAALKSPPDVEQPVRPWLAGVLRNLVAMQRRTEGRRAQRNAAAARSERLPSTAELIAQVDLQHNLARLVVGLPEPMRTTVLLRYHEGLSSAEIARIQGVPAGTVRWRLKRGVDQLRVEMDERYGARESWLASLALFARVEPAECAAGGAGGGIVSIAFGLLVAASLAALALNPGTCIERSRERPASLVGAARIADEPAVPSDLESPVAPFGDVDSATRTAVSRTPSTLRIVDTRGTPVGGARVIAPLIRGLDGKLVDGLTDGAGVLEHFTEVTEFEVFIARPGAFVHRVRAELVDGTALVTLSVGETLDGRVVARAADAEATATGGTPTGPGLDGLVLELDSDRHLWGGREFPPEVAARLGNGRRTRATTDANGRFTFHGLAPDWSGVLWLPGSQRVVGSRAGAYRDESIYICRPARDFVIEVEPRGSVTGRVVGEDHVGLVGAELVAWTPLAAAPLAARSGADGTFRFELVSTAARELVLEVRADPLGRTTTHRFGDLPSDGRLGDLVIARAARGIDVGSAHVSRELHVSVTDGEEQPASDVYVRIRARGALFADDGPTKGDDNSPPAREARPRALHCGPAYALYTLGPDGRLTIQGLTASSPIEVVLEDSACAVLARRELPIVASSEVTNVGLRVTEPLRPLTVTVRDETGAQLVGAVVQLGAGGERGVFRRTGLDGRTIFAGLSVATTEVDVEITKRGFVTSLRRGVALDDTPGSAARLDLVLERGIDRTFVVLDEAGRPVTDATVRVTLGKDLVRACNHTGEGRYQLQDVPRAELELHVRRGEQDHRASVDSESGDAAFIVHLPSPSAAVGPHSTGN